MGMYTELNFNVILKKETPQKVIDILNYMIDNNYLYEGDLPKHELFSTERWNWMFQSDSYYFNSKTNSRLIYDDIMNQYYLNIQCNLKNYCNEIEKFLDWIMHYIDADNGEFLGYSRYEEAREPILIYKTH